MTKRRTLSASHQRQKDLTDQAMRRERQLLLRVVQHQRRIRQLARQVGITSRAADRELRALAHDLLERHDAQETDERLPAAVNG
jgi:predicted ArsR family transcriptional regulator